MVGGIFDKLECSGKALDLAVDVPDARVGDLAAFSDQLHGLFGGLSLADQDASRHCDAAMGPSGAMGVHALSHCKGMQGCLYATLQSPHRDGEQGEVEYRQPEDGYGWLMPVGDRGAEAQVDDQPDA